MWEAVDFQANELQFMAQLRRLRIREQARFVYRELTNQASMPERMQELSDFADACLGVALEWLESQGGASGLIIFALGKLGGQELNLSSDVDLVFACADGADLRGLIVQAQRLIRLVHTLTGDGQVFRVDMRLRPWGEGSALVSTAAAMEAYYEQHGRDWERYAWIKARIIAGDRLEGTALLQRLQPFVYRRYLDVAAVQSLSTMKGLIEREERRRSPLNLKTGVGGIREIEFVVQAFQLLRGGTDRPLQVASTLRALAVLQERNWLESATVRQLQQDYIFLRRLEHALQAQEDQQTQTIPPDTECQRRLARIMDFTDWEACRMALEAVQQRVHQVFCSVIVEPSRVAQEVEPEYVDLWRGDLELPLQWLQERGVAEADAWWRALQALSVSRSVRLLSAQSAERLDCFIGRLLAWAIETKSTVTTLQRVLDWVQSIASRSVYLLLVVQMPQGMERMFRLAAMSPWIMQQMSQYPALLEEVLTTPVWTEIPEQDQWRKELDQLLLRLPEADSEATLRALRIFQKQQVVHLARAEIEQCLGAEAISQALTRLAEVLIERTAQLATQVMVQRYGLPPAGVVDFMVIAYGKLGSREMGYASDLDLVFVYAGSAQDLTQAETPLDISSFYMRLGQKMIHLLTAPMADGILYCVDMRLRPSGNAGLLVTSWSAYATYQNEAAWVWEHQALVRARPIYGTVVFVQQFDQLRQQILQRQRHPQALAHAVLEMREKMRQHQISKRHLAKTADPDVKHQAGGLVDIEFMVQYAVLRYAAGIPALTQSTQTATLLQLLQQALAGENPAYGEMIPVLLQAWGVYHALQHRQAIQPESVCFREEIGDWPQRVQSVWNRWFSTEDHEVLLPHSA